MTIKNCLPATSPRRSSAAPATAFIRTGIQNAPGAGIGLADFKLSIPPGSYDIVLVSMSAFEQMAISFHPLNLNVTGSFGGGAGLFSGNEEWLPFGPASDIGQPGGVSWNGQMTRGYQFENELPSQVFLSVSNSTAWTTFAATFVVNGIHRLWS